MTNIFKVMFDASTLKEAIVNMLDSLFEDALGGLTDPSSPFYQLGGQISRFVFGTPKLAEIRLDSWIQIRKVSFALLPLTAALTIWASMKEGLYSVTGYANTFEAVTEFVVSIALALASYWLMEQAISLTEIMTLAIADTLEVDITTSVFAGLLVKPLVMGLTRPILSMIFNILAFVFILVFMGSVMLAFLARELVLIMTVALAPVMIMLGSVRPLGWLRGLWTKAFFVFLLLLPINVLTLGIAVRLHISALDLATGPLATLLRILIIAGTLSVLISINGMLGKLVYGAAIQVTKAVGKTMVSMATMAAGLAVGAGALGGSGLGAVGGIMGGSKGLTPSGGGPAASQGAMLGGSDVTSTRRLTSTIGGALSGSRSTALRGFGTGLQVGNAAANHRLAMRGPSHSPPLQIAQNGVPGLDKGLADAMEQIDTRKKAAALGNEREPLAEKVTLSAETSEATLLAVEENGLSARDFLTQTHYMNPGRPDLEFAGREYIRSEAGTFAFRNRGKYTQTKLPGRLPTHRSLSTMDFQAAQRIVQNRQANPNSHYSTQITASKISAIARAVQAQRLAGGHANYHEIVGEANQSAGLDKWIADSEGLLK